MKLKNNSKIKLKCFFTLILVFTMVISSISNINVFANESYDYKYVAFEKDTNGKDKETDINGYALRQKLPNNKANIYAKLFKLVHKNNEDDVRRVYCLDVDTGISTDTNYSVSNIEDADYFDTEVAEKIRAIVKNSYPYIDIEELVEHIQDKTGDEGFNLAFNLETNREDAIKQAMTATQLAIWHYSNGFDYEGLEPSKNYTTTQINNVEKLYVKLKDLAEKSPEKAEIPVAKILSKEPIIVSENGDTFDIEFRFKIDENSIVHNIDYTIDNKPSNSEFEHNGFDEDGYKRIKVTNIPPGEDIKFVISGTQYVNEEDVFIYKPEGGRDQSQYLIGGRSGSINISKTFNYVFEELEAAKVLQGKDLKSEEFSFELLDYQGNVLETVKNSADGKIQFKPRTYTKVGTYTYKIREVDESLGGTVSNGITYDKNVYEVKVKVTDDGSGNLVSNVEYPNGKITFTNKYDIKETSATIKATKTLTGKNLIANMFKFKLLDEDGNVVETVTNDAAGNIKFSELTFDEIGTYTYQIVEVNEGADGMTYDSQPVDVKIKVEDKEGQLKASVSYPSKDPEFKNEYKPGSTSAVIEATKILEGKDLDTGMFSFELIDEEDNILQTVKNSKNGKVHFKAITYDKAGIYRYTVKEVKGTLDGIDYDGSEYEVTVKVTDAGEGNLVSEVIYPEGGVVFNNSYKVGTTSAIIEGTKKLTGKDLEEGMFSFELLDEDNKVLKIAKNSVDGKVKFEPITYDKVGTYKYKVREVKDTLSGIEYDESEYEVTVKVTDNGEGNLVSEVIYPEGGVLFENILIEGSVKLIKVDKDDNEKRIEGAKFVLLAEDKEKIIAENLFTDSEGKIIVSNLQPGTYYFKEIEAASGYILDDTLIEVKVEGNQQTISTVTFENEREQKQEVINPDKEPDDNTNTNSNDNTNINSNNNANTNSTNNTNTYSPKTSDASIIGYAVGGVVAVGALVGINRRRKNK